MFSVGVTAQTTKVLFIGNSYTGVNNLPKIIYDISISTGDTIIYEKNTPGGSTFFSHTTNANSQAKIKSKNWDYVVLQAQSQEPSFSIGQVENSTFKYAKELSNAIRANNTCSRPLFYMTWGRKNGDASNCTNWPPVCTYEGMDSLLNLRYRMMADMNKAYVSPVGAVWHYLRDHHPDINLYANDGSHPSKAGSYAAACTFYAVIIQNDPNLIQYNYTLSDSIANIIKMAAKKIVFDNLMEWNFGKFDPVANYSYNQTEQNVIFTNNSTYYHSLLWDFGDGVLSTEINPEHQFPDLNETYLVALIASNCNGRDTITQNIIITSTGVEEVNEFEIDVYPNPVVDILHIDNMNDYPIEVNIYDSTGVILMSKQNPNDINLSLFNNGLYMVSIKNLQTNRSIAKKIFLTKTN